MTFPIWLRVFISSIDKHEWLLVNLKSSLSEYSESEFLELLKNCKADTKLESELDLLVDYFEDITGHSYGSDLNYYPNNPTDATPERIIDDSKRVALISRFIVF